MRIVFILMLCSLPRLSHAETPPSGPNAELEQLLTALPIAPNEAAAARMEARISELWQRSAGPTAALLMGRAARHMQGKEANQSVLDYDAVLALEPNFADAFAKRALAKYQTGNATGAIADLKEALKREPRQFNAWHALSDITSDQQHWVQALAAWKKLLEIDPLTPDGAKHLKELVVKVEGEGA